MDSHPNRMLVSTRKGLISFHNHTGDWKYEGVHFMGIPVSFTYVDPFSGAWWVGLDHGHWGCKLQKSTDHGNTWTELSPPRYPDGLEVKEGVPASLGYIWALSNGGPAQPDRILVGTEPGGLFSSMDGGENFQLVESLWHHPSRPDHWFGAGRDHPGIHSIVPDPRDPDHILIGVSVAGVFETRDGGKSWQGRNKGLKAEYLPDPDAEYGHDPHLLVACGSSPDVLWQQNHCGIFRSTDGAATWEDVSDREGPAQFGFTIAAGTDPDTAWVVPAISDEIRVAVDNSLCVCRTEDGGKTWQNFRKGLPQQTSFDIVYRHALAAAGDTLAFGTTTGNLFLSGDGGESWITVSHTLPMVYAVTFQ